MTTPAAPKTVEELEAVQRKEYGTYTAVATIEFNGVRAFNIGDAVPVGHVESGLVSVEQVAKTTTKAAQAAIENGA